MEKLTFKNKMNAKELLAFKTEWAKDLFGNKHKIDLTEHITLVLPAPFPGEEHYNEVYNEVIVYGNHHIELGTFKPDNGFRRKDDYYPVIIFYNQLNYSQTFLAYNEAVGNNIRMYGNNEEGLIITKEKLLNTIRESYQYLKIFED